MKYLRQNILLTGIVLVLLGLVLIKSYSHSLFRYDARRMAEASFSSANLLNSEKAALLRGRKLVVDIDRTGILKPAFSDEYLKADPDSVLLDKYYGVIIAHKGPVVIASSDQGEAARIWMVIAQTGRKELFILAGEEDPEAVKYKFRPDTVAMPEL